MGIDGNMRKVLEEMISETEILNNSILDGNKELKIIQNNGRTSQRLKLQESKALIQSATQTITGLMKMDIDINITRLDEIINNVATLVTNESRY